METAVDIKKELWLGCRIIHGAGLVKETGHLSVRLSDDVFLIPGRKSPGIIKPAEILTLDFNGKVLDGMGKPNSEIDIHIAIYQQRPDVISIAHTHSDMCIILGIIGEPFRPVHNNGGIFGPVVRVFKEVGLIQTPEKAKRMALTLEKDHALLLRGHGSIITGGSLKEAVVRAIRLEYCARLQVMAMNAGNPYYFSAGECDELSGKFNLDRFWEYHLTTLGLSEAAYERENAL